MSVCEGVGQGGDAAVRVDFEEAAGWVSLAGDLNGGDIGRTVLSERSWTCLFSQPCMEVWSLLVW